MNILQFLRGTALLSAVFTLTPVVWAASDPAWWKVGDPPPVNSNPFKGRAVANIGQVKYLAKCALETLEGIHPATAALIEADLVGSGKVIASWTPPPPASPEADAQFASLNIGQLKAIAAPFYKHLNDLAPGWLAGQRSQNGTQDAADMAFIYPWTSDSGDNSHHALATLGQLKAVFALRFTNQQGVGVMEGSEDSDGDGLTIDEENLIGTSDHDIDTDGDGVPDSFDGQPRTVGRIDFIAGSLLVTSPLR